MIDEDLEELKHPKCNYQCGGWYGEYEDPTGIYSNGKVEDVLVDARTDMFIKRLIAFIHDAKAECDAQREEYYKLALAAAAPKNG